MAKIGTILTGKRSRYRIEREIGRGGFGRTFRAMDEAHEVPCVVKQFSPQGCDDPRVLRRLRDRFVQEAETLERLGKEHDRIPRLWDFIVEGNRFYLVQEFVPGKPLRQEMGGRKWTEGEARTLIVQICEVLAFVHQRGHVHRDLKPDNIMRRSDGQLVLIDFGSVKALTLSMLDSRGPQLSPLLPGTPVYCPVDRDSTCAFDVYSVGITAIEALSGLDSRQVSKAFRRQDYEEWDLSSLPVSGEFRAVLQRMVRLDAGRRYGDAREVLAALGESVPSFPPSVSPEYQREAVRTKPTDRVAPVNQGDSSVTSSPEPTKPPQTPKNRPTAKRRSGDSSEWQWTQPLVLVACFTVSGLVLTFSDAPLVLWIWLGTAVPSFVWPRTWSWIWAFVLGAIGLLFLGAAVYAASQGEWALAVARAGAGVYAVVVVVAVAVSVEAMVVPWAMPWAMPWAVTLARAVAVAVTLAEALTGASAVSLAWVWAWVWAWEKWRYIHSKTTLQKLAILTSVAGIGMALSVVLAAPFEFTIPADWSHLPEWLR